jgi:hypothetical protein
MWSLEFSFKKSPESRLFNDPKFELNLRLNCLLKSGEWGFYQSYGILLQATRGSWDSVNFHKTGA